MDFTEILKMASQNQGCAERDLVYKKGINTSVGKAKREPKDRPKGVKSAAVLAFLKKKEHEEKKKEIDAKKKRENLMKLREEKNTVGNMHKMIRRIRTKETIFEVEGNDKAGDETKTPTKKDESLENTTEYTKLKSQVGGKERKAAIQNVQRKQVSANWVSKEDREKAAIKEKESSNKSAKEADESAKRSNKKSFIGENPFTSQKKLDKNDKIEQSLKNVLKKHQDEKEVKKKKKPPGPPPMNFNDIIKLAEEKKKDPSVILLSEKKNGKSKEPKIKMPDRPMSQDEKERWMRVHSKEYQQWIKLGKARPDFCLNNTPKKKRGSQKNVSPGSSGINPKTPAIVHDNDSSEDESKSSGTSKNSKVNGLSSSTSSGLSISSSKERSSSSKNVKPKVSVVSSSNDRDKSSIKNISSVKVLNLKPGKSLVSSPNSQKPNSSKSGGNKSLQNQSHPRKSASSQSSSVSSTKKSANSSQGSSKKSYDEVNENVIVCGGKSNDKVKKMPEPEMSTWDRIYGEVYKKKKLKPASVSKKRVLESDSEQDSELDDFIASDEEDDDDMDDFIDDSGPVDISSMIGSIFGYNKKKYSHIDEDDLSDMEAGFADIEREEFISEQHGIKEDEEELKKEEAHQRRKVLMKKKTKKAKL